MSMTGAQRIVKSLEAQNVAFTFGLPGTHNLELIDALIDSRISNILVTTELCAAFMADGYARATGRVGVCIAIPGPGLTNMITGLAEALLDSSPLVAIVVATARDGFAFHTHEIRQLEAVAPVVKGVFRIDDVAAVPDIIGRAFHLADSDEPGPVVVEVGYAVLRDIISDSASPARAPEITPPTVAEADVRQVVDMLTNARQCGLYVGKGAQSAAESVRRLAERLSAPVATTISGKGVIAEDHDLAVGFGFGPAGLKTAREIFKGCDTVLALGVRFSEMSAGKWLKLPEKWIHIDRSRASLNRNYRAPLALCCDVETALTAILARLESKDGTAGRHHTGMVESIKRHRQKHLKKLREARSEKGIHPSRFFYRLWQALSGQPSILVTDCGAHQLWAVTDYCAQASNSFLSPSDYQAMGFGIPAAIGAALGCPEKCTVCVCGDGGFLMTGFELLTAVRHNLNLAVVVFNDGALGHIAGSQRRFYGRTDSVTLQNPDFAQLAAAFGVGYQAVTDEARLDAGLARIKQNRGIVILDVQIDYQDWPDYMKGVVGAAWRQLPLREKLDRLADRAMRLVRYGG